MAAKLDLPHRDGDDADYLLNDLLDEVIGRVNNLGLNDPKLAELREIFAMLRRATGRLGASEVA